jgi:hypothetical protein
MTGLRQARKELKAMREELGADRSINRLVTMEADADVDEAAVDAFLDREIGSTRDSCLVVRVVRFCGGSPPRIIQAQPYGGR